MFQVCRRHRLAAIANSALCVHPVSIDTASMDTVTESESCTTMLLLCILLAMLQIGCTKLQCLSNLVNRNQFGSEKNFRNLHAKMKVSRRLTNVCCRQLTLAVLCACAHQVILVLNAGHQWRSVIAIACHQCSSCVGSPYRFGSNGIDSRWRGDLMCTLCTERQDTLHLFTYACCGPRPTNSSTGRVMCCAPAKQQSRAVPSCSYVQGRPALMIARVRAGMKSKEHTGCGFVLTPLFFSTFARSPIKYSMAVATALRATISACSTMHGNLHHAVATNFCARSNRCGRG